MLKMEKDPEITEDLHFCVENCIGKLLAKFKENPFFFYTESDMHCYLYHFLLQDEKLQRKYLTKDGMPMILLHRGYPTVGRYVRKEGLLRASKKGRRGHFDLAILNPDSIDKYTLKTQKTLIAIEMALNEGEKHFMNDYTKLNDERNRILYGYLLFFVRDFRGKEWTCYPQFVKKAEKLCQKAPRLRLYCEKVTI